MTAPVAVRFHRESRNKKLSRVEKVPYDHPVYRFRPTPRAPFVSATYVSIESTCSDLCPFKRDEQGRPGGCFIEAEHFTRKMMATLDDGARGLAADKVIQLEVQEIDRTWSRGIPQDGARGGRDLRIHVGGDTPTERSARMLAGAAARWLARGGGAVWSYTHSWRSIPASAFWPISILASVETPGQVLEARARGYAPALVVEDFPNGKLPFEVAGTKFIPCPAETVGTTCVRCRLCLRDGLFERNYGIAFQVHGADAGAARAALTPLRIRRAA
jgi:hypothetical protein